jgi:hypothetical protein
MSFDALMMGHLVKSFWTGVKGIVNSYAGPCPQITLSYHLLCLDQCALHYQAKIVGSRAYVRIDVQSVFERGLNCVNLVVLLGLEVLQERFLLH